MTNQAAQTMPAVEAAVNAGLASYHGVKTFSSEVRLRSALEATARAMLAAAPAASGGEVWTREMVADVHRRGEELYRRIHGANPPPAASVSERARDDLHVAICQAVALMNMEPMTTSGLLQAHDILRKAIS